MLNAADRQKQGLGQILDRFYLKYDFKGRIAHDPVEFLHRYEKPEDIEASGFIASCLAYGKVEVFKLVIDKILAAMGGSPYSFLMEFDVRRHKGIIGFKYRFNEAEDILCLVFMMHKILFRYSSIEKAFMKHYRGDDLNTGKAITGLINEMLSINTAPVYGKNIRPPGLVQLMSSPAKGSACKRINLFLRWMARDKDIDLGIWKGVPKNKLIIPLDAHIARISRCLGLSRRTTSDWKTAVGITEALKIFDAGDPLKYDFALCHHGISGLCNPKDMLYCKGCVFAEFRDKSI